MKTYKLYAIREVGEVAVIQANSKDEAIEEVKNKDWQPYQDLSWEITSVKEEQESEDELWWMGNNRVGI